MDSKEIIYGKQSTLEALKTGRPFNKLYISKSVRSGGIANILALANENGIVVEFLEANMLNKLCGNVRHQGVVASVSPVSYATIDDVFQLAEKNHENPFLLLLDELQDPQNVGALLRTAEAAGVHGVLLPKRNSCPLTGTVAKISCGAINHILVVQIGNISYTIDELKKRGCWIVGADMDGKCFFKSNMQGALVLVLGAEGKGLGRLVKENCDAIVSIPMIGTIGSLNASAAGAILMYEIVRQRLTV